MNRRRGLKSSSVDSFLVLVVGLLFVSTNFGLINRFAAIQGGGGENLIGLRDGLVALALAWGLLRMFYMEKTAAANPIVKVTLVIVYLTPIVAAIGLMSEPNLLFTARSAVVMLGWLLVWVIASNLVSFKSVQIAYQAVMTIGLLIAVGVYIEMITQGHLRVVTPADVVTQTGRSTPSGWPIMMVTSSQLLTGYLFGSSVTGRRSWIILVGWLIIVVASLLTQSRTLLVGITASTVTLLLLTSIVAPHRMKLALGRTRVIVCGLALAIVVTLGLGDRYIRDGFSIYFLDRYSVLVHKDKFVNKLEEDERRAELVDGWSAFLDSPLWGLGLATTYRTGYYMDSDSATRMHNVYAFFLYRYGPAGILLFILLIFGVFKSLVLALRSNSSLSTLQTGLAVGLINLFFCAYFGNVFATTYGTPQAMVTLAILVAAQEVAGSPVEQVQHNPPQLTTSRRIAFRKSSWMRSSYLF